MYIGLRIFFKKSRLGDIDVETSVDNFAFPDNKFRVHLQEARARTHRRSSICFKVVRVVSADLNGT